jgi:hypothetical protein
MNLSKYTTVAEFKDGLLKTLMNDTIVRQIMAEDHSRAPGDEFDPEFILSILVHFTEVNCLEVAVPGRYASKQTIFRL